MLHPRVRCGEERKTSAHPPQSRNYQASLALSLPLPALTALEAEAFLWESWLLLLDQLQLVVDLEDNSEHMQIHLARAQALDFLTSS